MLDKVSFYYKQLSPSVRYATGTGIFLLVSTVLFLFLYFSKSAELKSVQMQIKEVENAIVNGQELQARCKLPTDNEQNMWNEAREAYCKKIPPEKKVLELVKEIAKTAQDCSIYDISFSTPGTPGDSVGFTTPEAAAVTVPPGMSDPAFGGSDPALNHDKNSELIKKNQFAIKTSFHCGYRDLARFLEALSGLSRMLEPAALTIERKVPLMSVEMTINAFYAEDMEDA